MKQKEALDILKAGRNVYLTGAAGSGKTYVLNDYINYLKERGVSVAVTASTGIAATHIGGVTIHSWSGIGIRNFLSADEIERLEQREYLWKRYQKAKVLIIDEVSMLVPTMFDSIETLCRKMKRNEAPFGGMQVILSGDFFQLPPIVSGSSDIRFIDSSESWAKMDIRVCYLEEQYRQEDQSLMKILGEIREGEVSLKSRNLLDSRKDKKIDSPTKLYTHNVDVDSLNEKELAKLGGKEYTFQMITKGKRNLVENLKKSILAPEVLKLKKEAVVMFVKNGFDRGYVNGTLGVVKRFEGYTPIVRTFSGKDIAVIEDSWAVEEDGKVLAEIRQLPLRLAWAITVHKSQGMSLDAAEIDLSKAFTPGQGYVALSRLRSLGGLNLKGLNQKAFEIHQSVKKLDQALILESLKWQKVIKRFSERDMQNMHTEFIKKSGGTLDEKEIKRNRAKNAEENTMIDEPKIPSHEKTLELLKADISLEEIAKERGMVLGTIISHLEKLKDLKTPDLDKLIKKYKPKDFEIIKKAFTPQNKEKKLAPVFTKLKGKYSYEDIRSARLFI